MYVHKRSCLIIIHFISVFTVGDPGNISSSPTLRYQIMSGAMDVGFTMMCFYYFECVRVRVISHHLL